MAKRIDLTGKLFGEWSVISYSHTENGRAFWKCKCSCGTEKILNSSSLLYGRSKSCGCLYKKEDLSGRIFNEFKVLRFDGYYKSNPKWICVCSCGKEVSVYENGLKSGASKNCGDDCHNKMFGKRFSRLVVMPKYITEKGIRKYLCICDCGKEVYVSAANLTSGNTKSCGCLSKEVARKRLVSHGHSRSRIYNIWIKMIDRCENQKSKSFEKYGKNGITVCKEWHNFKLFFDWAISNGYDDNLTIDRINGSGNYEPNNCRWATYEEQANNTKKNLIYVVDGKRGTLAELARCYDMPYKLVYQRVVRYHWDIETALLIPANGTRKGRH